jgi:hypothetical protein
MLFVQEGGWLTITAAFQGKNELKAALPSRAAVYETEYRLYAELNAGRHLES